MQGQIDWEQEKSIKERAEERKGKKIRKEMKAQEEMNCK